MKRTRAEGACTAIKNGIFGEIVNHVRTVAFPIAPVVRSGDGRVGGPHGRVRRRAARGDLREKRKCSKSGRDKNEEKSCDFPVSGDDEVHSGVPSSLSRHPRRQIGLLLERATWNEHSPKSRRLVSPTEYGPDQHRFAVRVEGRSFRDGKPFRRERQDGR